MTPVGAMRKPRIKDMRALVQPSSSPPFSVLDEGDGDYHVLIVRGGNAVVCTPFPINDSNVDSDEIVFPVMSPDGSKIIYRMPRLSDGREMLMGVAASESSTPVEITGIDGHRVMHPMWHPDSDQIVYGRGESFAFGGSIWSTDYSGSGPTQLYMPSPLGGATGYYAFRPQFNYDGTKIAFWLDKNSGTDANEGLYVMDADGSSPTLIRDRTAPYRFDGAQFSWANTQDKIVYEWGNDVYTIDADGTNEVQVNVAETATQDCRVSKWAWASDDSLVYFSSRWSGGGGSPWRPYSAEPDGGGIVRLNDDHGPYNQANATNVYRWHIDDRIYFVEQYSGSVGYGLLASVATDGSDYREDWHGDGMLDKFYTGTAIEYV